MKIINLISGPRNLSTAIMYSFAQHETIQVIDEPFYAYYLTHGKVNVDHPRTAEILQTLPQAKQEVINLITDLSIKEGKHVFVKGMAHHYLDSEPEYILEWTNIILIRHPKKLLASFSKVISNPSIDDIGIKKAAKLFSYLQQNGKTPLVIDSDELLKGPKTYLTKICNAIRIPFQDKMLSWKEGGIHEDGVWATHWYKNVHNSNEFSVQKSSSDPMPKRLDSVFERAMTYYNVLSSHILKNN